jgi:hypothetical protein
MPSTRLDYRDSSYIIGLVVRLISISRRGGGLGMTAIDRRGLGLVARALKNKKFYMVELFEANNLTL